MEDTVFISGKKAPSLTSKLVVMSFHPVTKDFSARIEHLAGPVETFYDAANLRKLPLSAGIRELRNIRADRLIIALESDVSRPLIAPLSIAAAFTRATEIVAVWPDLRVEPVGRLSVLRQILRVAYDTLKARTALRRLLRKGAELGRRPMPRPVEPSRGSRLLYLDANISLGVAVGGSIGHTAGVIDGFVEHSFHVDYASVKPVPTERENARALKLEPQTLLAIPPELNFYSYAETIMDTVIPMHRANPWSFIYQRFSLHNFVGPDLGRVLGVPVVLEFNGSEAWAAANWGTPLALHQQALTAEDVALRAADLIVTVSDELGRQLLEKGIPANRVVVYPNCVDADVFDTRRFTAEQRLALREKYGVPADACVVGFIGTFGMWHGVEFLAECIRDLVSSDVAWIEQNKIHLMLVGDGLKMPAVRQIVGAAPVSKYVTLTGMVAQSEAAGILAAADLLVCSHVPNPDGSSFFGSPTKLFEYMAMEKPIVASALGQIDDVIAGRGATRLGKLPAGKGEMCGFLFEPGNADDFKATLRRAIADREEAAKRARAARAEVLSRYTWSRHVEAILDRMTENGLRVRTEDRMA